MHVLIIPSERYVTQEEPFGGIFQYHQAHALKRAGLQVGVIAPAPRSLRLLKKGITKWTTGIEFEDDQGIPVYRYQGWDWITGKLPYLTPKFRLQIGRRLFRKYIAEHGMPDIVHAHNAIYAGIIAAWIKKNNTPYVITEHSSSYARKKIRQWQLPLVREALKNAAVRVVVSTSLGKTLETQFGQTARPWEWIPNILDKTFETTLFPDNKKTCTDRTFRFLNIAGLVETKNHANLLRAFADKFRGKNNVQLRIGGSGPLRCELEALAKSLGIAHQAIFLGPLGREQVYNEMQACSVFVLSSDYETFGVVLIEALACGKPVIATACGGPECIVHSENGMLIPSRDVAALGNAMEEIQQKMDSYDSTLIRYDCIDRFGENAVVEKLRTSYARILCES